MNFGNLYKNIKNSLYSFGEKLYANPIVRVPLNFLRSLWRFITSLLIPALLILLIVMPAIISAVDNSIPDNVIDPPVEVSFGNIDKTIRSSATIEYDYEYSVRSYQNAVITNAYVSEGQTVDANAILANLDIVGQANTITTTEIDNQIATLNQDRANLEQTKQTTLVSNDATSGQQDVQLINVNDQISEVEKDIEDLLGTNAINNLNSEIQALEDQYDDLVLSSNVTDSIISIEAEIEANTNLISTLQGSQASLQASISSQQDVVDGIIAADVSSGGCGGNSNEPSCQNSLQSAEAVLDDLLNSFDEVVDDIEEAEQDNRDLREQLEELEDSEIIYTYEPGGLELSDGTVSSNAQREISELQADITEAKGLQDQLNSLERTRSELIAGNDVQNTGLTSSVESIDQSIASIDVQLANLYRSRSDLLVDMSEQIENEVLTSRRRAIVARVNYELNEEIPAGDTAYELISEQKLIRLQLNAENRESIAEGMRVVIANPDNETEASAELSISKISISPISQSSSTATGNNEVEYEVEVLLPDGNWTVGKDVDVDIIIESVADVRYVPSTSVFENKVYVARGAEENERTGEIRYREILDVEIALGLETGRFVEVIEGLQDGDLIFSLYPRTDQQKLDTETQYLVRN